MAGTPDGRQEFEREHRPDLHDLRHHEGSKAKDSKPKGLSRPKAKPGRAKDRKAAKPGTSNGSPKGSTKSKKGKSWKR